MKVKLKHHSCNGCIWEDQCGGKSCEDYDTGGDTPFGTKEYKRDISERHQIYQEQLKEMEVDGYCYQQ